MSEHNEKITLKTLAKRLGLSVATVDRALNKRGDVKKETYDRIMKAVDELGYTPNKSASYLSRRRVVRVAVIFQHYPAYFWDQIESGVDRAAKELADYGLSIGKIRIPNHDLDEQVRMIEEVVEHGKYDAIAISSDGSFEIAELIDRAIVKGIPTCTFNTDSPISKRLFYVGADYREAGKLAGELLSKFVGGQGKVALILEKEYMFQFKEKVLGFREVVDRYSKIQMVGPLKVNRDNLAGSIESLKEELAQVDGIYLASGELGILAKHIDEWGFPVQLVGHDMADDVYEYLKRDVVTATICQEPYNQGYTAVKQLFEYVTQQMDNVPPDYQNKLEVVMRENADYYL